MGHCKSGGRGGSQFYSRDFNFGINILNLISTPHKHSFFVINVLSLSRDLPHPFYCNQQFIDNTYHLTIFFFCQ